MTRTLPANTRPWPEQLDQLPVAEIVRRYEDGCSGILHDAEASARFWSEIVASGGQRYGSDAAAAWTRDAAGQLVAMWVHVEKTFPGCWPGAAQERGDCVSHGTKNAALATLACEIVAGRPDEVTQKLEGVPEIPPAGITEGALSTEWLYWWRGYNGDGWNCDVAADVAIKHGLMLRRAYAELGIDLTNYSGSLAGQFGSRQPPAEMDRVGREHCVRTATELQSFEEVRDFLANGYGISSCGGEGFSSTRNEDGVSERRGGWSHAMAYIGADDRDVVKSKYGGPLVLVMNSWGKWNGGPRRVLGTQLDIPEGSFWARWQDISRRYMVALSSVAGWPARDLPNWGLGGKPW